MKQRPKRLLDPHGGCLRILTWESGLGKRP